MKWMQQAVHGHLEITLGLELNKERALLAPTSPYIFPGAETLLNISPSLPK
jgi:hypothetical protein